MAKHSIHLSKEAETLVSFLSKDAPGGSKNYSGSVNGGLMLLKNLMEADKPELTPAEWEKLFDTYAGQSIAFDLPIRMATDIMGAEGVADRSELDAPTAGLVQKLLAMSQCQQAAVLWEIKRLQWESKR